MKKLLPFILLTSLLLSACSIDWNDDKDKKIAKLERQIEDDSFSKKQECEKYKKNIEDAVEKRNKEGQSGSVYAFYNEMFREVFYSRNGKSCFALIDLIYQYKKSDGTSMETEKYQIIQDVLSGDSTNYDNENLPAYYSKVKELKGE